MARANRLPEEDSMIRVVSLVTLTEKGLREIGDFASTVAMLRETVIGVGGTLEHAWATAGAYDFVAVLNFPDPEAEFRARNKVHALGVLRAEHLPAIPIEQALKLEPT
jgi:uncharacterized protein with GYD domain